MRRCSALLIFSAWALAGCSDQKQVPAIGPGYEFVILAPTGKKVLAEKVQEVLSVNVGMIREEPAFQTVVDTMEDFAFYTTRKLLFAVATDEDPALEKLLKRSSGRRARTRFPGLFLIREPFAAGQSMFVMTGEPEAIVRRLSRRGPELLSLAEEAATELLHTNVFRAGEVGGAREAMQERFGWGVRLPPEWVLDDRFAERRFVRVWRDAPVCQLFVSWEEGRKTRTPEQWLTRRGRLVDRYYQGDEIVLERSTSEEGPTPLGIDGVAMRGLWENDEFVIGGPFHAWAFYCPADDRTYLIDLSVYAPDRDKRPLERTLEAVLRTFRFACSREAVT